MTAIDPDDIRVGDTVRRVQTLTGAPIVVSDVLNGWIYSDSNGYGPWRTKDNTANRTYTWELIDRPVPNPADGSKWKPVTGSDNRWIYDAKIDLYVLWRRDANSFAFKVGEVRSPTYFSDGFLIPDTDA